MENNKRIEKLEKGTIKERFSAVVGGFFGRIWRIIKTFFYNISVFIKSKLPHKKSSNIRSKRTKDMIFYCLVMIFPVLQFIVFYIFVNANSILLSFQRYDIEAGYVWANFEQFRRVFFELTSQKVLVSAITNSLINYVVGTFISAPLTLLFSYYVYKKLPMGGFFKIMLFLPSIISSIIMIIIYKYFVERAVPEIVAMLGFKIEGLISNPKTTFATVLFYNIWIGFGGGILMYCGAMSTISDSLVESARLEGATVMQEFFHITLPLIYPTLSTFLIVGVAGLFTSDMGLYTFFGPNAEYNLQTLGYFLFKSTILAPMSEYPYLSAFGLLLTIVAVPLTLIVKFFLEKFGPSVD